MGERQMTQAKEIAWIELEARCNSNNVQKKKEPPNRIDKMRQMAPLAHEKQCTQETEARTEGGTRYTKKKQ